MEAGEWYLPFTPPHPPHQSGRTPPSSTTGWGGGCLWRGVTAPAPSSPLVRSSLSPRPLLDPMNSGEGGLMASDLSSLALCPSWIFSTSLVTYFPPKGSTVTAAAATAPPNTSVRWRGRYPCPRLTRLGDTCSVLPASPTNIREIVLPHPLSSERNFAQRQA